MMTTAQKKWITATVPVLKEHDVLLTTHFYERMFKYNPELKNLFNMGNQRSGKQQTALAMSVLAYAENIANPSVLGSAVNQIGHKHVSLNVQPAQYLLVGHHLIASIKEVLGDTATPEIIDAWEAAYGQLAKLMSEHEATLYKKQVAKPHGWSGWRSFKVGKKVLESIEITSFYLYPMDGEKVPLHIPGQYISVQVFLPELQLKQARQYSISSAPNNEYYRISIKREKGATDIDADGLISNYFHDCVNEGDLVDLTPPAGTFVLPAEFQAPLMLISGGVGLTPLISILQSLIDKNHPQPITWLHGCRNRFVHAFKDYIDYIAEQNVAFEKYVFYNTATEEDLQEGAFDGYLDINRLPLSFVFYPDTHYFICGPAVFIQKQYQDLLARGVDRSRIFFEEFGPGVLQLD
jgi:nitric oxide dioxygenase